jgi:hypothetical protein
MIIPASGSIIPASGSVAIAVALAMIALWSFQHFILGPL